MTRNIYALLVGIDNYLKPVTPLKGCINDVVAIEEYLRSRVKVEGWNLDLKSLKDEEATRQNIINNFRQHLGQAKSNDIVLFYYSGHGSREEAPREFWDFQPDRLNETLVCYDSRSKGGWDLADKELSKLISEVAQNNPQITIILDCCHSGSGSRDPFQETNVREFSADERQRSLDTFIFSPEEIQNLKSSYQRASGWSLVTGKHILFASCREQEKAKEYNGDDGQTRGAFCYFLTEALKKAKGNLTYRDLFKQINALVRSKVQNQSPQLEATNPKDLDQLFLGGAISDRSPYYTISHHKEYGWVIDGGAVHGVPLPVGEETMHLALFPVETRGESLRKLSDKIAEAKVTQVLPQLSKVEITSSIGLDREQTFKAVITALPLPPKTVRFEGETEGVQLLREALQNIGDNGQPSVYVREVEDTGKVEFKVLAHRGRYIITRPADGFPLASLAQGYNQSSAIAVIHRLEHITRWTNLSELSSPANSRISPDAIQMEIYQDGKVLSDGEIRLSYYRDDRGKWKKPAFQVKLKNTSNETLYCALLDLTEQFAINAGFFEAGYVKLEPNQEIWALGKKSIRASVPQEVWEQGITEFQDIFKLIVCTNEFDARLLEQDKLDLPYRKDTLSQRGSMRAGTLNRLMNRLQYRDLEVDDEAEEYDDWVTSQVVIKTIRPLETTPIPKSGIGVSLGAGVLLQTHPYLQANARLINTSASTRGLDDNHLPPLLRENSQTNQPFPLTSSRGIEPALNTLELREVNIDTIATVNRENPLKLIVDTPLIRGERVLPFAYDGEFYLPLGVGYSHNGRTEIRLERLPEPVNQGERDLKGALKIFFQKIVSEKIGLEFSYPHLAIANVAPDETVSYESHIEQVKQRVTQAEKIVLFIHGITGETANSLPSMQRGKVEVDGQEKSLAQIYDLILSFDYENLHTSIEENARLLKDRLETVGLGANHGKQLEIVAHSMGGLISRWFIEREGGKQVVNHLIMLGTPNAGSPWSTVEDWAIALLTFGLNGLSTFAFPAKILSNLLSLIEKIDISLDQMQPGSDFLKSLAASSDPSIPYSIIAGNNSMMSANIETGKLQRLMQKLRNKSIDLAFFGQTNDTAVTVRSITSVDPKRIPQPQIQEVGCDHVSYFSDVEGLTALTRALIESQKYKRKGF
ncbi:MAG: caspase family protein [Mastigocoleus sp. MO_167.B18]|nr:caspase family protein [Mastigocoleus sp. MO_167.B18]